MKYGMASSRWGCLMNDLLTYRDVAKKLQISERTVWDLVKSGEMKACRIAKRNIRITDEALQEYLRDAAIKEAV